MEARKTYRINRGKKRTIDFILKQDMNERKSILWKPGLKQANNVIKKPGESLIQDKKHATHKADQIR